MGSNWVDSSSAGQAVVVIADHKLIQCNKAAKRQIFLGCIGTNITSKAQEGIVYLVLRPQLE